MGAPAALTPMTAGLASVHMRPMTEKTLTPASAGTPTFLQWFRSSYGLRAYAIVLIILVFTFYVTVGLIAAVAGITVPVPTIVAMVLTVAAVAYAVAKLRRGYRLATAPLADGTASSLAGGSSGGEGE